MTDWQRPGPPDRDPALDAAWKAHSTELPPPRLDAAILAAAHREARTRPQAIGDDDGVAHARGPSRAWWGLAAAATIGAIAFGLLHLDPPPPADPSATVATDVPRTAPDASPPVAVLRDAPPQLAEPQRSPSGDTRPPADALTASREKDRAAALTRAPDPLPGAAPRANAQKAEEGKQRRADAPSRQRESAVESPAPAARALVEAPAPVAPPPAPPEAAVPSPRPFPGGTPAPSIDAAPPASPPAPASTPPAELAKSEAQANAADARGRETGERMAAAAPTAQAGRAQADSAAQGAATAPVAKMQARTPAAWIERIRAFHAEQRLDEAARELNRFREAYPDADTRLPPALQTWAAGIKRN